MCFWSKKGSSISSLTLNTSSGSSSQRRIIPHDHRDHGCLKRILVPILTLQSRIEEGCIYNSLEFRGKQLCSTFASVKNWRCTHGNTATLRHASLAFERKLVAEERMACVLVAIPKRGPFSQCSIWGTPTFAVTSCQNLWVFRMLLRNSSAATWGQTQLVLNSWSYLARSPTQHIPSQLIDMTTELQVTICWNIVRMTACICRMEAGRKVHR